MFMVANELLFTSEYTASIIALEDLLVLSPLGKEMFEKSDFAGHFSDPFIQVFLNDNDFEFKKPSSAVVVDPLPVVAFGLVTYTGIDVMKFTPRTSSNFDEVPMYRVLQQLKQLCYVGDNVDLQLFNHGKAEVVTHTDANVRVTAAVNVNAEGSRAPESYLIRGSNGYIYEFKLLRPGMKLDPSKKLIPGVDYLYTRTDETIPQPPKKDDEQSNNSPSDNGASDADDNDYKKSPKSTCKLTHYISPFPIIHLPNYNGITSIYHIHYISFTF